MLKSKVKELKVKNDEAKKMKNQIKKQDDHISSLVLDIRKQESRFNATLKARDNEIKAKENLLEKKSETIKLQ